MHESRQGLRGRPFGAALLAALWLATWLLTVLTWERDAAGYSIGMAPIAIPLHLVLPLLLGVVVAHYRDDPPGARAKACALAGLVFGFLEFGVLCLMDLLWIPPVESPQPFWELAAGVLVGAVVYAAVCVILGMLGGALRAGLATSTHHGGGGTPPPARAGSR
jgi:hypothetical protein